MSDKRFLLLGAGMMGRAIAYDLAKSRGKECLRILDSDKKAVESVKDWLGVDAFVLNIDEEDKLKEHMEQADAVIVALPYRFNSIIMQLAIESECHFCDLGGNDPIVAGQLTMDAEAKEKGIICIPDCGLAPGMANVLAANLVSEFDSVETLTIRVGGLPQHTRPPLNYQLVFSVGGLINEYIVECKTLRDGKITYTQPMTDLEKLEFEGLGELEAFNTSGGTAWLPEIFQGKIKSLDYKTIRYSGHCEKMKTVLDMGMASEVEAFPGITPRMVLEHQLKKLLGGNDEDVVLVRITADGVVDGKNKTVNLEIIEYFDRENNITAMMRTTAFPTSIIIQMAVDGIITEKGVKTPEMCVPGKEFKNELAKRNIVIKRY